MSILVRDLRFGLNENVNHAQVERVNRHWQPFREPNLHLSPPGESLRS
jgi:hypothetical protein